MGFNQIRRNDARVRKHRSIRKKVFGTTEKPRLFVFKSAKNIYAQLIDDVNQRTITSVSSLSKELRGDIGKAGSKTEVASMVGKALAEKAKSMKIETVVFDRGGYLYHGRVKALAESAREGGLKF